MSGTKRLLEVVVVLSAIAYFALFNHWNSASTEWHLWFTDATVTYPAAYPVVASFLAGIVLSYFVAAVGSLRRFSELRRSRKEVALLQAELNSLRGSALSPAPPAAPAKAASPADEPVGAKR